MLALGDSDSVDPEKYCIHRHNRLKVLEIPEQQGLRDGHGASSGDSVDLVITSPRTNVFKPAKTTGSEWAQPGRRPLRVHHLGDWMNQAPLKQVPHRHPVFAWTLSGGLARDQAAL